MQKLLKNTKSLRKYSIMRLEEIPLSMYFPAAPIEEGSEVFHEKAPSKLESTKLKNGIVVKSSDYNQRGNSVITVQVNAGSRYETYKTNGTSHFVQRFFFDHTNTRTKLRLVTEMGKTGANVSSSNSREHMTYKMETMREAVPKLFELLSDSILGNRLHESDLEAKVELVERDVQEYANAPEVVLNEALHKVAYGEKGLGRNVLCPPHNLFNITTDGIVNFFDTYYRPERISVIGTNINHQDLVALSQHFLNIEEASGTVEKPKAPYVGGELRLHENPSSGASTYSVLAFKGTCQNDADELYPFAVLATLLGDVDVWTKDPSTKGKGSLLYKKVVESDSGIAAAKSFSLNYSDAGLFGVFVSGKSDSVGKSLPEIVNILKTIATGEISEADLTRAKKQSLLKFYSGLESNSGSNEFFGKFEDVDTFVNGLKNVTKSDISRVCGQALKTNPTLISYGDLSGVPTKNELFSQ